MWDIIYCAAKNIYEFAKEPLITLMIFSVPFISYILYKAIDSRMQVFTKRKLLALERDSKLEKEIIDARSRLISLIDEIRQNNLVEAIAKNKAISDEHLYKIKTLTEDMHKIKIYDNRIYTLFYDVLHLYKCALSDLINSCKETNSKEDVGELYSSFHDIIYKEIPQKIKQLDKTIHESCLKT